MSNNEKVSAWRRRAMENLDVAVRVVASAPPAIYASVSRLYYSLFQAVCAKLLEQDLANPGSNHGEVWRAADKLRPGLHGDLQDLYSWRRKADYAVGEIPLNVARGLIAKYASTTRQLTQT